MSKERLLRELTQDTFVMIRPSPIEGIGVFAIRDIPKGCRTMFSTTEVGKDEYVKVPRAEVDLLPAYSKHLVETYCLFDAEFYFIPEDGFKKMDLVYFLNHSETPNIASVNDGEFFETLRDIATGEELLVNYGTLVDES